MTISRSPAVALSVFLMIVPCAVGCRSGGAEDEAAGEEPTAKVRTAAIRSSAVVESVEGFGTVTSAPGSAGTLSVPFECQVRRILVSERATVAPGSELAEIEPSPEAALQLSRARDETKAAGEQRALTEQRLAMKLATREDLQAAEQRLRLAEITQRNLESRVGGPRVLRADAAGVVARVDAQPGQILPAGASLLQFVTAKGLTVRLGVELSEAPRVQPGQKARLESVQDRGRTRIDGHVVQVVGVVDPQTRLVDVFVGFEGAPQLRLNEYVHGRIETGRHDALVVPRDAVVPEEDRAVLFTVEKGHAVRHEVRTGIDDGEVVEVEGPGVTAGADVVVQGAAELQDGMAVTAEGGR